MSPRALVSRVGGVVVLILFGLTVAGCGPMKKSKVTKANYEQIKNDMTLEQVEDILGRGQPVGDGSGAAAAVGVDINAGARPSSVEEYTWQSGSSSISVSFRKGKVIQKKSEGL